MNLNESGLSFGVWFLIGCFTYCILVFFCTWVRYCIVKKSCCPPSPCCMRCAYQCNFCHYHFANCVDNCTDRCFRIFSCKKQLSDCCWQCCNRPSSAESGLSLQFFKPNCREINCCCCRLFVANQVNGGLMDEIELKDGLRILVDEV